MICKWKDDRELCTNSNTKHYYFLCVMGMNLECKHYEENNRREK